MPNRPQNIAQKLFDEHKNGTQSSPLEGDFELISLKKAYDVQEFLNQMFHSNGRGEFVGHKVALTSKPIQELCGLDHPVFGAMFSSNLFTSPYALDLNDFHHPGLEFELAVEMGEDLPLGQEFTAETLRPYVSTIYPAFEIIEDRNADYSNLDVLTLAADNAWFGAAILGAATTLSDEFDIVDAKTRLQRNGEVVGESITGAALGNPLTSAAALANHLSSRSQQLKRDSKIITGSTLATLFPVSGDHFVYEIEGVGSVELKVS